MNKIILLIISLFVSAFTYTQNCTQIPVSFRSYEMAVSVIRNSTFKISDRINTSNSSWMRGAEYYSCDGKTGYFIYSTARSKTYIHKGVPLTLWDRFKNSSSFGSFYNSYIKGKYLF